MIAAGVIGWPVAHSKSPLIHRFWLAKLGIDGDYGRFPVHPDSLGDAIRALPKLGLRGVNVTVPHKVAAMALVDRIDASAMRAGAINTIVAEGAVLTGYNTDITGFAEPLIDRPLAGKRAVVIGAGGAARAVVAALAERRIGEVIVLNRDIARAQGVLAELGQPGEARALSAPVPPARLIVNATSLGMSGQPPLPVDLGGQDADCIVYDIVYAPLETPLLAAARARGMRTIDGLQMLVGQAAAAFELFFGQPAPREHDAELRALLTA